MLGKFSQMSPLVTTTYPNMSILSEETLAQKFVRKWFWLYFFTLLIWPLGYVVKIVLSSDLSVAEVGLIYGVISLVTLIGTYNDLGCTESLNFFLPKYILKKEYWKGKYIILLSILAQAITSVIIASILWIWAPWIADNHFKNPLVTDILFISGFYFIGINILQITTAIFSVVQNTKLQKWMEFIRIGLVATVTCILFFTDLGTMNAYMWSWLSGVIVTAIISVTLAYIYYYRPYFSQEKAYLPKDERTYFVKYALATLFTTNIAIMLSQVDMQLLFYLIDGIEASEQAGYYGNYLSLMSIPFILIGPIVHFIFPVVSELYSRGDKGKIQLIYARFSLYFSIIAVWISLFFFQFWEELSILLFTEKFAISGTILKFSAFFLIFNLLAQINFQILSGTGRIKDRAKILLIILPINIILNVILIKVFHSLPDGLAVYGSALAVWITWIPLWYLTQRATREYQWSWDTWLLLKNIWLVAITYCILIFIGKYSWELNNFFVLSIAVFVNLIIFSVGNRKMLQEMISTIRENRHA